LKAKIQTHTPISVFVAALFTIVKR
jgi:hypothetical protein